MIACLSDPGPLLLVFVTVGFVTSVGVKQVENSEVVFWDFDRVAVMTEVGIDRG